MMISTRGRYALRVLIDLAEHGNEKMIPMKQVAQRQDISLKYIEQIIPSLVKAGFVEGTKGKGGGYRLTVKPEECRVSDILNVTEEGLAPVACLKEGAEPCPRANNCKTLPLWKNLYQTISDYLDSVTLKDLL